MATQTQATIEDLYRVDGKAEIVDRESVLMPPTGEAPGRAGGSIYISLRDYERKSGSGRAYTSNVGFIVDLPNRQSFSPAVAFHIGKRTGQKFLEGAPLFAVEVRREGDYGKAAERKLARKRADYFAAGTLVVWDVDLLSDEISNPTLLQIPIIRKFFGAAKSPMPNRHCLVGGCRLMSCSHKQSKVN